MEALIAFLETPISLGAVLGYVILAPLVALVIIRLRLGVWADKVTIGGNGENAFVMFLLTVTFPMFMLFLAICAPVKRR